MAFREQLLEQLATGPKRPSDLDGALLGYLCLPGPFGKLPPYSGALTELVNNGLVNWHRDDTAIVWYELAQTGEAA